MTKTKKDHNGTKHEQGYQRRVLNKLWSYLDKNYHKFDPATKTKVAIALCSKDLPQHIKGEGFGDKLIFQNIDVKDKTDVELVNSLNERFAKQFAKS